MFLVIWGLFIQGETLQVIRGQIIPQKHYPVDY